MRSDDEIRYKVPDYPLEESDIYIALKDAQDHIQYPKNGRIDNDEYIEKNAEKLFKWHLASDIGVNKERYEKNIESVRIPINDRNENDEPTEPRIVSGSLSFIKPGKAGLDIYHVNGVTLDDFHFVGKPRLSSIKHLFPQTRDMTEEDAVDQGLVKNGSTFKNATITEGGLFDVLWNIFRHTIVSILYWKEFHE